MGSFPMAHLKQHIGLWQGTGLLVSTLLGSGVFIVPAMTASLAGSWSLLAWVLMGILILPIVFTFASLGKRYPDAGGTAFLSNKPLVNAPPMRSAGCFCR